MTSEASPAVSDDMVERVARAIWEQQCQHWGRYRDKVPDLCAWDDLTQSKQRELMREARAAIAAMSPQQVEPVAWMYSYLGAAPIFQATRASYSTTWTETPLYRHPPVSDGKPA